MAARTCPSRSDFGSALRKANSPNGWKTAVRYVIERPIVIRTSEEMLKLVPEDLRQASDGIGARRSQTVTRVVLPAALPGIVSGAMLAVARAAGETAPLLFTIGISRAFHPSLTQKNTALPMEIWNNAQQPYPASQNRAWGAALTLITIVFVLTVIARIVSARFATKPN